MHAIKHLVFGLVLLGLFSGCTNQQLRLSTNRQARTLTQIQYEQVLDNLAMYCVDPSVLPSLMSIRTGSTQIGDTGTLGVLGVAGLQTPVGASPTFSASRSIVDQWGNAPITDDNELMVLRKAFRAARGIPDYLLELKDANDLGHDLCQQIGANSDFSAEDSIYQKRYDILAKDIVDNYNKIKKTRKLVEDYNVYKSPLNKQISILSDVYARTSLDKDFIVRDPHHPGRFVQFGQSADPNPDQPSFPSTGLAKEAVRRLNDIQEALEEIGGFGNAWYHVGCRREVPKDACYVGRARRSRRSCGHWSCDAESYVWVCSDGLPALADVTLNILKLSGTFKDTQIVTSPSGVQYSPAFSR